MCVCVCVCVCVVIGCRGRAAGKGMGYRRGDECSKASLFCFKPKTSLRGTGGGDSMSHVAAVTISLDFCVIRPCCPLITAWLLDTIF